MYQERLPFESRESRETHVLKNRRLDALHELSPLVQSPNRITIRAMSRTSSSGVIRLRERDSISKRLVRLGCQIDGHRMRPEIIRSWLIIGQPSFERAYVILAMPY